MGSDELICFSSDYPHWDFDSPLEALPPRLPEDLTRKIFSTTRAPPTGDCRCRSA